MIKITEKDILFIIINIISFMSLSVYMLLDFIANIAQIIAAADPQYANLEVGLAIIRILAYSIMIIVGFITLSCDLWFGYRFWKQCCAEYWRDNL